jgi:hypothetical protein
MKKFNILLLLSFVWLATSCDDKPEMNYVQKNNLTGKWIITETGAMNSSGGLEYYPYVNDDCGGTDVDNIVFNEDLTFAQNDFSNATGACQLTAYPGTYVQENHALTLTQVDIDGVSHKMILTITKLDYTHLEVTFEQGGQLAYLKLERE